VLLFLGSS
jgi:hypothetical protein